MLRRKAERSAKFVASPLAVHVWSRALHQQGFVLAGHLDLHEEGMGGDANEILASFTYSPDYLDMPGAYPLDPVNLPMGDGTVSTRHAHIALGSIFDAAPDAWGRRVIQANETFFSVDGAAYTQAFLRGADGIGALLLKPAQGDGASSHLADLVNWSRAERPTLTQLNDAALAARRLEDSQDISEAHRRLLAGSWTIGGARPKAIVRNEGSFVMTEVLSGQSLIAKFPSSNESIDRAAIEWACLRMARDMGFEVPGHALATVSTGRALLLERFDRYPLSANQSPLLEGRRHYVSANSLISSVPQSKRLDTMHDKTTYSFGKLISVAAQVSAKPLKARVDMFARLMLNTALHNTDDHLKNFGFIQDDDGEALRLSPVFDVSPQGLNEHFIHLGQFGRKYTVRDVRDHAREFGIKAGAAADVEEKILTVLAKRQDYFDQACIPMQQQEAIERLIQRGVGDLLSKTSTAKPAETGSHHLAEP